MFDSRSTAVAALVLLTTMPGGALALGLGDNMVEGACLYMKQNDINVEATVDQVVDSRWRRWAGAARDVVRGQVEDRSPLCQIDSPAGILLATANYIDQAALSAAKGIARIEAALGLKETLTDTIIELEVALQGQDPSAQIDEARVKATHRIGERAREIEAELAARDGKFLGSDELAGLVVESQKFLEASSYYQVQSGLGVTTFTRWWRDAPESERNALVANNGGAGVTTSFAATLPQRGGEMVANVGRAVRLGGQINKTLDKRALDDAKDEIRSAREASREEAALFAQQMNGSTTGGFMLAGAEPEDTGTTAITGDSQLPASAHDVAVPTDESTDDPVAAAPTTLEAGDSAPAGAAPAHRTRSGGSTAAAPAAVDGQSRSSRVEARTLAADQAQADAAPAAGECVPAAEPEAEKPRRGFGILRRAAEGAANAARRVAGADAPDAPDCPPEG